MLDKKNIPTRQASVKLLDCPAGMFLFCAIGCSQLRGWVGKADFYHKCLQGKKADINIDLFGPAEKNGQKRPAIMIDKRTAGRQIIG